MIFLHDAPPPALPPVAEVRAAISCPAAVASRPRILFAANGRVVVVGDDYDPFNERVLRHPFLT